MCSMFSFIQHVGLVLWHNVMCTIPKICSNEANLTNNSGNDNARTFVQPPFAPSF